MDDRAQPDFHANWLAGLTGWRNEVARWGATTVGFTMSRERELRTGTWRGASSGEEILAVVHDLWDEAKMEAEAKAVLALRKGAKPNARMQETLMVMHFSLRVVDWMIERIDSARGGS